MSSPRHPDAYRIRFCRELGIAIRRQREDADLSLRQVSEALNCGQSTVAKWEDGTSSVPAFALHQLEQLFGCNLYDLMPVMSEEPVE